MRPPAVLIADAAAAALSQLPDELQAAWAGAPESERLGKLCDADFGLFRDEDAVRAAVATCVADFERRVAAEALQARRASEARAAEAPAEAKPKPPPATPGYAYRPCRPCRGKGKRRPTGEACACALAVGGRPGFELCAEPWPAGVLAVLPHGGSA